MRNDLVLNYDLRREIILLTPLRFYIHVFIKLLHLDFIIKCYVRVIQYARAFTPNTRIYFNVWVYGTYREITCAQLRILRSFISFIAISTKFRFDVFMSHYFL